MPLDERMLDQNDPNIDTIANLQRSITATLNYIMGRASVAELFGLQGYLSQLASRMTDVSAGSERSPQALEMPVVLAQQLAEMERQRQLMRELQTLANSTPAQYRQES